MCLLCLEVERRRRTSHLAPSPSRTDGRSVVWPEIGPAQRAKRSTGWGTTIPTVGSTRTLTTCTTSVSRETHRLGSVQSATREANEGSQIITGRRETETLPPLLPSKLLGPRRPLNQLHILLFHCEQIPHQSYLVEKEQDLRLVATSQRTKKINSV